MLPTPVDYVDVVNIVCYFETLQGGVCPRIACYGAYHSQFSWLLRRSTCLASSHIQFPEAIGLTGDSWCASDAGACEAEHISSSAGFFSFKREGTGRSDLLQEA